LPNKQDGKVLYVKAHTNSIKFVLTQQEFKGL